MYIIYIYNVICNIIISETKRQLPEQTAVSQIRERRIIFMKYEVFFLLQQYHKNYPEQFHTVEPEDLKKKYKELKSEEVDLNVYTVNSGDCRSNRSRNVY